MRPPGLLVPRQDAGRDAPLNVNGRARLVRQAREEELGGFALVHRSRFQDPVAALHPADGLQRRPHVGKRDGAQDGAGQALPGIDGCMGLVPSPEEGVEDLIRDGNRDAEVARWRKSDQRRSLWLGMQGYCLAGLDRRPTHAGRILLL